jgi:hypothetical protein
VPPTSLPKKGQEFPAKAAGYTHSGLCVFEWLACEAGSKRIEKLKRNQLIVAEILMLLCFIILVVKFKIAP